ncbi:MAG: aryl-sulfate sulfotransferase [Candidatus Kapabacteria bacterium]|nr:aryl-sulfate sulfotransferase [Candidatus Kapabacteria bacterium]
MRKFLSTLLFSLIIFFITNYSSQSFVNFDKKVLKPTLLNGDTLPPGFPELTVVKSAEPYDGYFFFGNNGMATSNYLIIMDNDAKVVKYKRVPLSFDFKVQPNGLMSYQQPFSFGNLADGFAESNIYITNSDLATIDSFQCKSGYIADFHDFKLLPNGHSLLISYDVKHLDLSQEISDGHPDATVIGAVVQELDRERNVVFQWRSWDHIPLEDCYYPINTQRVDYVHINSVELDDDGHLLISSRHINQITKINRQTGEIIWRLGGKGNEFTFINENEDNAPDYFSEQHDARRLDNGNITIFDNGNRHKPEHARAVEYELDEINKTAKLIWEYRHTPDILSRNQGSTQRLPNGGNVIGWGGSGILNLPSITEVTPNNEVAIEVSLPKGVTFGQSTYRAYKFPYPTQMPVAEVTKNNITAQTEYDFKDDNNNTSLKIFVESVNPDNGRIIVKRYNYAPLNPDFDKPSPIVLPYRITVKGENITSVNLKLMFDISLFPRLRDGNEFKVYFRPTEGQGKFNPIATTFDNDKNTLSINVNDFGEFIFGKDDFKPQLAIPKLFYPINGQEIDKNKSIDLRWAVDGMMEFHHIQVAKDPDFNQILFEKNNLTELIYRMFPPYNEKTYYWRVRTIVTGQGNSDWSEVYSFSPVAPYFAMKSPNGGEVLIKDNLPKIIRWYDVSYVPVKIDLFRNGSYFLTIIDSVKSFTNNFLWNSIPEQVPEDSSYQIKVTNINNPSEFAISKGYFAIKNKPLSVEEAIAGLSSISDLAAFPNPSEKEANISFNLNKTDKVTIKLFDLLGNPVNTVFDGYLNVGYHNLHFETKFLLPGVYQLKLQTSKEIHTVKIIKI